MKMLEMKLARKEKRRKQEGERLLRQAKAEVHVSACLCLIRSSKCTGKLNALIKSVLLK